MNIWVIGRSYPMRKNKMRGSFELEQAQLLSAHGHSVTYLAVVLHPINKVRKWGFCHFKDGDIHVFTDSIFFAPERMHLHPKRLLIHVWKKLLETVEKERGKPDIIHIHYPGMNSIPEAVLPYQAKGVKIVTTDHWTKTLTDSMDPFQRNQLITYANQADAVLCVGQPLKESILKITQTEKSVQVVPNVVSSIFSLQPKQENKKRFDFIAVGRLAPVKQMDQIALGFAKEFAGNKNIHLTIVGGGKEKEKIDKVLAEYQIQDQVTLTGTLSREETAKRVMASDCLVCFSRLETFGVPVIEAWACGIPVVASDCLGFLEYWNDDLGYIVPHNEIEKLQEAMRKVFENRDQYDAVKIAEFANDNFGEDAIRNRLLAIYSEII